MGEIQLRKMTRTELIMQMFEKLAIAALLSSSALTAIAPSALAEDVSVEGNVALVSDYRFRGATLSDETIAIQGGLDFGFASGFYLGTWGSSIEPVGGSEMELDLYGGFSGDLAEGVGYDVGAIVYMYPGEEDAHYIELYGSLGTDFGDFGAAFAPEQDNLGDEDNLYVYYAGSTGLGASEWSLDYGIGYETGVFGDLDGDGDDKIDWTIGLSKSIGGIDFGVAYIGTSEDVDGADDTVVLTIGRAL